MTLFRLFPRFVLALLLSLASVQAATFYSAAVTNDRPIMYWNFDEADGSPAEQQMPVLPTPISSENDLVPTPGTSRSSHATLNSGLRLGNAVELNGTNYFLAATTRSGKSTLDGAYAVEFWFQSQAENAQSYLLNFGGTGADNSPAVIYNFNPGYLEFYAGAAGRTAEAGPLLADQQWHHLLFVYYGDGADGVAPRLDAYLDGVNFPGIGTISKRLSLGALIVGAALPNFANAFTGRIDELAVYDLSQLADEASVTSHASALATEHIASARSASGPAYSDAVLADSPYFYWSFDEAEGNALQRAPVQLPSLDNSKNTLQPTGSAARLAHTTIGSGLQLGNTASFDGASSFQVIGGLEAPLTVMDGPWAVELWFQFTADQANRYLLNLGRGPGYNSPAIIYGYFGPRFEVFGNGRSSTNGVPVNDQNWHHLLVVNYHTAPATSTAGAPVNRVDFFIDNLQYTNVGGGFNRPLDFGDWLIFGAATPDNSGGMIGRIDELALYDLRSETSVSAVEARASTLAASHYAAAFGASSVGVITITTQPVGATSAIGQTVSFSVAASVTGTTSPLTYQWFRDNVAIANATNVAYTTPALSLYDVNTHQYAVRVSAGPAFKFSAPAPLIVPPPPSSPATPYSLAVTGDSPVLYWNFDEMFGPAVQQRPITQMPLTTENDLVPVGSTADRIDHAALGTGLGKLGKAIPLDGASYLRVGSPRLPKSALDGPWAVEFWMRFEGDPTSQPSTYLVNFGNPGSDNSPAFIYGYNPSLLEVYAGASGRSGTNGPAILDNDWHHVLWVNYDSGPVNSNKVDAYIDGINIPNAGGDFSRDISLSSFLVGAATMAPAGGFLGAMDELAVYDLTGLSTDEVSAKAAHIATNHFAEARSSSATSYSSVVLADQPLLYYNFDEAQGEALQKAAITLPPLDPSKNNLIPTTAGRVQHSAVASGLNLGNSADFDGKAYFEAAQLDAGPSLSGPWAIEFWTQIQGENITERQQYLANFGNNGPAIIYDFKPDEMELFAGVRTDLGPIINDANWHHILWAFYGDGTVGVADRVDAYLDGNLISNVRNDFSRSLALNAGLLVGSALPGYNGFQGRIDELAVYDLSTAGDEAAIQSKLDSLVAAHLAAAASSSPQLSISRTGNLLILSWQAAGFILQQNTALGEPNNWTAVAGGAASPVTIEPTGSASFFRLFKQP